jgi:hypothetical protein
VQIKDFVSACVLLGSISLVDAAAQNLGSHAPPAVATGAERLLVEQIEELSKASQFAEAAATLQKLFEQSEGRLIEAEGSQRAATQITQRYIPIRQWSQLRLAQLLRDNVAIRQSYLNDHNDDAAAALAELSMSKDLSRVRQAAERFSQTTSGHSLQLLSADLYLERGWGLAAMQAIQRQLPCMRFAFSGHSGTDVSVPRASGSLPWAVVIDQWSEEERRRGVQDWNDRLLVEAWQTTAPEKLAVELLKRSIDASIVDDSVDDRTSLSKWTLAMANTLPPEDRKQIQEHLKLASTWHFKTSSEGSSNLQEQWPTFGGNLNRNTLGTARLDPGGWPTWNHALERFSASSDRISASKPRVAESEVGLLSYHPAVYKGRVYVN